MMEEEHNNMTDETKDHNINDKNTTNKIKECNVNDKNTTTKEKEIFGYRITKEAMLVKMFKKLSISIQSDEVKK